MSVLAISFSKHVVSPLEILQEGRKISSSNWDLCGPDLCSPKQLCRTSGSVGSHSCCSIGQQHCLTRQALSVAHGDTWQSSDPGAQPPSLEWEPGKPQDTGEPAAQLQASASLLSTNPKQPGQAGLLGHLAPRIPKIKEGAGLHYTCLDPELPAKEQCPGQPQVGAVLELLLQRLGQCWSPSAKECKETGEKAGPTLLWKPQSRKAESCGVKFQHLPLEVQTELPWSPCSKGEVTAKGISLTFAFPERVPLQ